MAHIYSIGKMVEIKDKNIILEDKVTEEVINQVKSVVFYGRLTYPPKGCIKCGIVITRMRIL